MAESSSVALKAVEDQIVAFLRNPPREASLRHIIAVDLAKRFVQLNGLK